jgi:hypothetical protein
MPSFGKIQHRCARRFGAPRLPGLLPDPYQVSVRDVTGADRDRIYAERARRFPGLAEYARQTEGVRTIPVLELSRA